MKLRNKKTGEIWDMPYCKEITMGDSKVKYTYKSLAEVNENWEDYIPKAHRIKDEKARKLVLAWAKLTQTTKILTVKRRTSIGAKFTEFFSQEKCISLEFLGRFDELEDGKEYGIEELCGEEEECLEY